MLKMVELFSGIGGISIGAEMTGNIETVAFCEIEPYPVQILKKRWPNVPIFKDVRLLNADTLKEKGIEKPDILAGGFPCQPFSVAGKKRGRNDERFLWGEFARLISELRPSYVIAENVPGLASIFHYENNPPMDSEGCAKGEIGDIFNRTGTGILYEILEDFWSLGYTVQPIFYPSEIIGAPQKRERCFFVANTGLPLLPWSFFERKNEMEIEEQNANLFERSSKTQGMNWPTPRANNVLGYSSEGYGDNLPEAVNKLEKNWPTPSARDYKGARCQETFDQTVRNELTNSLPDAIRSQSFEQSSKTQGMNWPTPTADSASSRKKRYAQGGMPLTTTIQGQLNPNWVEILMGFDIGWTDIDCNEPISWPGWPAPLGVNTNWATPNTMDVLPSRSFDAMKSQATNGARKNRSYPGNLREQIDPLMREAYVEASRENGGDVGEVHISNQYPYEPPRTTTVSKHRAKRLKCLGNAVVPQQIYPICWAISKLEEIREEYNGSQTK